MTDKELINKIRAQVERWMPDNPEGDEYISGERVAFRSVLHLLDELDSLPDEPKCIFGNKPSEEGCRYCTASCELRVPKTESSSSVTFEEYLYGTFEINSGLDNDPGLLVTLHAPALLELAKEKLRKDEPKSDADKMSEDAQQRVCDTCSLHENCAWVARGLERKCNYLSDVMYGYELCQEDMKAG